MLEKKRSNSPGERREKVKLSCGAEKERLLPVPKGVLLKRGRVRGCLAWERKEKSDGPSRSNKTNLGLTAGSDSAFDLVNPMEVAQKGVR